MFRGHLRPVDQKGTQPRQRMMQEGESISDTISLKSSRTDQARKHRYEEMPIQRDVDFGSSRSSQGHLAKNLVVTTPQEDNNPLQLVRRRFVELQSDELTAEWALNEFLLKCKQKPSKYVNFQQPMDDRSKQMLMLSLYECIEAFSDQLTEIQLDHGTVGEIRNEINMMKVELDETLENLTRERLRCADLSQEVQHLQDLVHSIHHFRLGFSQYLEIVVNTFISVFKMIPAELQPQSELNEHVRSVVSLIEAFETNVNELEEDTRNFGYLWEQLPSKNAEIKTALYQLNHSRPVVAKARIFLKDYVSKDDHGYVKTKSPLGMRNGSIQ